MDDNNEKKNGFESAEYEEFWPVEHPTEPMDEDTPVDCPMPHSSLINGNKVKKQGMCESLRKRAEVSKIHVNNNTAEPPLEAAMRKRHHTLSHPSHGHGAATTANFFISPSHFTRLPQQQPTPPPPPYNRRTSQPTFPLFTHRC